MSSLPADRRTRWMVLPAAWLLCAWLILAHARSTRDYLRFLDETGRHPGQTLDLPRPHVVPGASADAQMWVHHALSLGDGGAWRVRFTHVDNSPLGREVHWSALFTWIVAGGGALRRAFTGESPSAALEGALAWINAPLLFGCLAAFSIWVARRFGPALGAVAALGFIGHDLLYEAFAPLNVDHHGLIAGAVLGTLFGAAAMGLGWLQPGHLLLPSSVAIARRAALGSAACGAFGLWLSAASVLPVIGLAGAAGLAINWRAGPAVRNAGAVFDPSLWRLWGRAGGALSAVFYLFEYAPFHLGWRLEVNHPLYAAAWWGGAEIVARLSAWRLAPPPPGRRSWRPLLVPALTVVTPPAVILAGGTAVFVVTDPFVANLRHFVAEGSTLAAAIQRVGLGSFRFHLASGVVLALGAVAAWRTRDAATCLLLSFLAVVAAALAAMGCAEIRWWQNAGAAQLALLVGLLAIPFRPSRPWVRPAVLALVALLFILGGVLRDAATRDATRQRLVRTREVSQLLFRHLAQTLRATEPSGALVVLADPDASLGLTYYGGVRTIGTLYWENASGLKAAAEILCATDDARAASLLRARGVTHVVSISRESFLGRFHHLLRPHEPPGNVRHTFGYRLAARPDAAPTWLQPVPYRRLAEFAELAENVAIFKVAFDQTEPERLFHLMLAQLARDAVPAAGESLDRLLALTPGAQHGALCAEAAARFYDYGADAAAVRLFRRALALQPDPLARNTLAWILATSNDHALRNGRDALALVESPAGEDSADAAVLSTYAAACAELGRFPAAIAAAERALALARAERDAESAAVLQKRLAAFRAHRPWRQ